MQAIQKYYWLTKPGIVFSNVIAAMAGFFLASSHAGTLNITSFLGLVIGTGLVIASACVFNNYLDRGIDRKMKRTSWRATASGKISPQATFIYLGILGAAGFGVLSVLTNFYVVGLVGLAYFCYVVLYGIAKRKTIHSTLVGTIPGGIPPVAGYVAVTNNLDVAALLLFVILLCWQMAHFYAIGMRRRDEYAAAGLPVMPVVKGMRATKIQIVLYIIGFVLANILLVVLGYVGYVYLVITVGLGLAWLFKAARGFHDKDEQKWAKRVFLFSLVVLLALCFMLSIGALLP